MNASRLTGTSSSVTQEELNLIGECLKKSLEHNPEQIFTRGQHYLVDVYEGAEARKNWEGEMLKDRLSDESNHTRVIYRMMSGVIQKQQKNLYPWTTFSFKPAAIDGASGQHSFLNLQLVRSISRKLWAMVRVHHPMDSKRPPELCCYVDRHIPSLDVIIEPQIRIPLKATMKLGVDERNGIALPAALFSDNPSLGKPLQASPQFADVMESEGPTELKLTNSSEEPITVCEIALLDFDEDDIDTDEDVKLSGIEEGQVIKSGESITVSISGSSETLSQADCLIIGYARGTSDDLDEDDDELMTEEELNIKLQGEDTRTCHISLAQGEAYELLKRALLTPTDFISNLGEDLANDQFISGDEDQELEYDSSASLMLNSADLDGGSIGTLTLKFKSLRPLEDFAGLSAESQEIDPDLYGDHFTFGGRSAIPSGLTEPKRASRSKSARPQTNSISLEVIYLGRIALYNQLSTLDNGRARDFILNCVGVASLLRTLKQTQNQLQAEDEPSSESLLDHGNDFFL